MRVLDLDGWSRRQAFELYRGYADPTFDLAVRVPVGGLVDAARERGCSPFGVVLHAIGEAVHAIEPFRMRLRGDQVVVHDTIHPGWVVLAEDDSVRFCGGRWDPDLARFLVEVSEASSRAREAPLTEAHAGDDAFFVTCMPWVEVVGVRHARRGDRDDSVPRFAWGRLGADGFVICVSAHHALVDGLHVARLAQRITDRLSSWVAQR